MGYPGQFTNYAKCLWQGRGVDVKEVLESVKGLIADMESRTNYLPEKGVEIPMEYVSTALGNLQDCIQSQDDYQMADCLYYQWKEIAIFFEEIKEMMGDDNDRTE